jgi:hypothetical protein
VEIRWRLDGDWISRQETKGREKRDRRERLKARKVKTFYVLRSTFFALIALIGFIELRKGGGGKNR